MGGLCSNGAAADDISAKPKRKTIMQFQISSTKSLDVDDARVVKRKTNWLKKQKTTLQKKDFTDWETLFDEMCNQLGKTELTFAEMQIMFRKMGTNINRPMLQLLFRLFDANNNGVVDKTEFLVAATFLSRKDEHRDVVDLAYEIFDTNRSGSISKEEFTEMCIALMAKASFVLSVPFLRKAFRNYLESNFCAESLDFYEAVESASVRKVVPNELRRISLILQEAVKGNFKESGSINVAKAEEIYKKFVSPTGEKPANVSSKNRTEFEKDLEKVKASNLTVMDTSKLDQCVDEVIGMVEQDSLPRFKDKVKADPSSFANVAFESAGLKVGNHMHQTDFRKWAALNPHAFDFLLDLQVTMRRAEYRQKILAAIRIQRFWRRKKNKRATVANVVRKAQQQASSPTSAVVVDSAADDAVVAITVKS